MPTGGFALWNECAPIGLLIESLDDDAAAIDLTEERIQTLAESRLRAARLYDTVEGNPYLYIRVTVLNFENRSGGAFHVRMSFNKYLREDVPEYWRNEMSDLKVLASIWDHGTLGTHGGDAGFILQFVSEHLAYKSDGSLYFTDPPYGLPSPEDKELDVNGIYRLDPDGTLTLLADLSRGPTASPSRPMSHGCMSPTAPPTCGWHTT